MSSLPPFAINEGTLTPDEVVRQLLDLPSAPRVLPRLKRLLSDGNSSIRDVVEMIRLDPGIAARVLRMGNSIYYSQGLRCYTVDEAVNRVGYDHVYELVANAVASQVLVRPLAVYGMDPDDLWRQSVACGLAAETLARHLKLDLDVAYTVGLLYGVGLVAIDAWAFRQNLPWHFAPGPLPLETCQAERAALGFHNGEAGAALLRLWEFPAMMTEPVRWQYLPRGTAAHLHLASALHVAKWVRSEICSAPGTPRPDPVMLRSMNLSSATLDRIVGEVRLRFESVSSLLETEEGEIHAIPFPGGQRAIEARPPSSQLLERFA
jgi:HD-like signal output (HDOD) protein